MTDRYDIRVELNPKPIPDRRHDWDCWLVDDPEFGTESAATPWEALRDMADRLEMEGDTGDWWLLEDSRQRVGNCLMFWKKGRNGYCCDMNEAHLFTEKEAFAQVRQRSSDVPRRLSDMRRIQSYTVDHQRLRLLEDS